MIMFVDGYSDTHITFRWETSSGMDFVPDTLQMHPQYILSGMELSESFTAYVAGMFIYYNILVQYIRTFCVFFIIHRYHHCFYCTDCSPYTY